MNIVERIKELQMKKDGRISLNKLEKELGFGKSTISSWEQKKPASDKLEKLADYFNVSVDYLLGRVDSPAVPEVPVALSAPQGYDNLTDEQKELIQSLIDKYNEKNIGNK